MGDRKLTSQALFRIAFVFFLMSFSTAFVRSGSIVFLLVWVSLGGQVNVVAGVV